MHRQAIGWRHYYVSPKQSQARGYVSVQYALYQGLQQVAKVEDVGDKVKPKTARSLLHVCPPHMFNPMKGYTNIIFSMWEGPTLPRPMKLAFKQADFCIVPSKFCKDVWEHEGIPAVVVPLGVHDAYTVDEGTERRVLARQKTGDTPPLRFLFVGSKQKRKGWHLLAPAWREAFAGTRAHVQLYCKTIAEEGVPRGVQGMFGDSLLLDTRDLDANDLLKLYRSADVFVFPSYGEGFGLPPLEAMAAGCLVIAPYNTGMMDFLCGDNAVLLTESAQVEYDYHDKWKGNAHNANDLALAMRSVYEQWGSPIVEQRRRNGIRTARQFTWTRSATLLAEAITALEGQSTARAEQGGDQWQHAAKGTARRHRGQKRLKSA